MNPKAILLPTENSIEIKHALLYWDELLIPKIFLMQTEITGALSAMTLRFSEAAQVEREENPDFKFLIQESILERPNIFVASQVPRELRKAIIEKEMHACLAHSKAEGLLDDERPYGSTQKLDAIEMSLYSTLPTPGNVPFQDILDFKEKRKDELQQFRVSMGEIYIGIVNSNDIPRSKSIALYNLERSLKELNAAAQERWHSKFLSTMKVELNLPNILLNATAGVAVSTSFGLPPEIGAGVGAIAGMLKFEMVSRDVLRKELTDFEYIYEIYKHKSELEIT